MDKVGGGTFIPTEFVDISSTYGMKGEALSHHVSQIDILAKGTTVDLLDTMEAMGPFPRNAMWLQIRRGIPLVRQKTCTDCKTSPLNIREGPAIVRS